MKSKPKISDDLLGGGEIQRPPADPPSLGARRSAATNAIARQYQAVRSRRPASGSKSILTLTRDLGVNLAGVDIILNLKEQIRRLQEENEMLTNLIRRTVQKHSEVPRYHSLVKVDVTTLKVVDEE